MKDLRRARTCIFAQGRLENLNVPNGSRVIFTRNPSRALFIIYALLQRSSAARSRLRLRRGTATPRRVDPSSRSGGGGKSLRSNKTSRRPWSVVQSPRRRLPGFFFFFFWSQENWISVLRSKRRFHCVRLLFLTIRRTGTTIPRRRFRIPHSRSRNIRRRRPADPWIRRCYGKSHRFLINNQGRTS